MYGERREIKIVPNEGSPLRGARFVKGEVGQFTQNQTVIGQIGELWIVRTQGRETRVLSSEEIKSVVQ